MPIYAYRCTDCGFAKDVLQKLSDPPLTACPQCGKETFAKQVTAAGFQLKGSGWYVTDFRGGASSAPDKSGDSADAKKSDASDSASAPAAESASKSSASDASAKAPAPAPASAPAPSGGGASSGGSAS